MEKNEKIKESIAQLREKYLRLALTCRSAGIRISPQTVEHYRREIEKLQALLN